jgi:hypothetical protein
MNQSVVILVILAAAFAVVAAVESSGAQYVATFSSDRPTAECLTAEQKQFIAETRKQTKRAGPSNQEELLDPDYFVGAWQVEWVAPESPLGREGDVTGTLNIKHVQGCYYEGTFDLKGPDGAYTAALQLTYDVNRKYLVWVESDSRGFRHIRMGPVGGDPGGYYTYFWEEPVMKVKDINVALRGTLDTRSPVMFLLRQQISVGGAPFDNFGTVTFTKDMP